MREIVMDTETTGFEPSEGHRIVEIGAVELVNLMPTGRIYHQYINPQRDMPTEAFQVHGISEDFLRDKPVFADIAHDFLGFIGTDSKLVIHNASFDMKFLNAELSWCKAPLIAADRAVDTLQIARRRFPGSPASLDALCRRFGIDNSAREKHGALLDSEILAEVYLELSGGRQPDFGLSSGPTSSGAAAMGGASSGQALGANSAGAQAGGAGDWRPRPRATPLPPRLTDAEAKAHEAFVTALGEGAIWSRYRPR